MGPPRASGYKAQAEKSVDNMLLALEAAGAGITDVVSTRVLVASNQQADLVTAWEVVHAAFGDRACRAPSWASRSWATVIDSVEIESSPRDRPRLTRNICNDVCRAEIDRKR